MLLAAAWTSGRSSREPRSQCSASRLLSSTCAKTKPVSSRNGVAEQGIHHVEIEHPSGVCLLRENRKGGDEEGSQARRSRAPAFQHYHAVDILRGRRQCEQTPQVGEVRRTWRRWDPGSCAPFPPPDSAATLPLKLHPTLSGCLLLVRHLQDMHSDEASSPVPPAWAIAPA